MYITSYHNYTRTHVLDYNNLNNTQPTTTYIKRTTYVANPTPRTQLPTNKKNELVQMEMAIIDIAARGNNYHTHYLNNTQNELYYTFQIPKRSGGLRTINAPIAEFKTYLREVKDVFERKCKCLAHDSAYAYVKQRSTINALQKHQANNSQYYLKLDLKDFFTNCQPDLVYKKLIELYPFYYFGQPAKEALKQIIQICSLNNGLPQGTPMSPTLTNLMMVSYDFHITNRLRQIDTKYVYTRYADDLLISHTESFNFNNIVQCIELIVQPFVIKKEKTRYGSKNGSNWNLGLMLNKDNKITVGYKKKHLLNAMLNNFLRDQNYGILWSREDTEVLQGQLSYLNKIEPGYYAHIRQKYEQKYHTNLTQAFKTILN